MLLSTCVPTRLRYTAPAVAGAAGYTHVVIFIRVIRHSDHVWYVLLDYSWWHHVAMLTKSRKPKYVFYLNGDQNSKEEEKHPRLDGPTHGDTEGLIQVRG